MFNDLVTLSQHFLDTKNQTFQRYFMQHADLTHRMNVIIGPRGVGKTTTLIQTLLAHVAGDWLSQKILYLPAGHFLAADCSLYEIAEQFVQFGRNYLAIDEIHQYSN